MKEKVIKLLTLIFTALTVCSFPVQAAGTKMIDISEGSSRIALGGTSVVSVDYSGLAGGIGDLGVISANTQIAMAGLTDAGNKKANLSIVGTGMGSTTIAVYSLSNPAIVDYITVYSGLTANTSEIVTQPTATGLMTVFCDRIVNYPYVLTGDKEDQLQVTGLVMERKSGRDCLKVTGNLLTKETKIPGMNTFYANFYGASGELIRRQAVYSRDPYTGLSMEIFWYVPEGCASITLE